MESKSNYSARGCLSGKTVSPRLQKLENDFIRNGGCFKEFRIGNLFTSSNGDKDIQKNHISSSIEDNDGILVVSSGEYNLGIIGTTNLNAKVFERNTLTVDMFGNVNFRDHEYKMVTHARVFSLRPREAINKYQGLYIQSNLSFLKKKFSYNNMCSFEKIKDDVILLPSYNDKLAFDYMESYIRELEQERIRELDAYLKATGLNDYELTPEEKSCIEIMENGGGNYKEFKVLDIFTVKNTQSVMKSQVDYCSGDIPYVTAGENNNSIASYVYADSTMVDKGDCIVIGGKSTVVTYQELDFVSNDSHNLALYMKDVDMKSKHTQMFFVTLLGYKFRQLYNWGNSISKQKIKKDTIHIPTNLSGDIDYNFIEVFSKAIEKLSIRSVVEWKDRIIETTRTVVSQNTKN